MQIDESWNDLHLRTSGSDVTFGVLGPLEVRATDGLVHVGGPQIRALLALLLVRPGHVISLSTLVASLWSGDAPPSAERTARTYMSRLRLALAPLAGRTPADPLIVTTPPGYLLRADPLSVDASRFEQLALAGRRALTGNDLPAARSYLRSALRLWRGDAYAEFADVPVLRAEASRLEELRLSAVETRLQAELSMGLGPDLVAELDGLVTTHPLRERLWVQYMTALYRSGRQAEALSAYQRARGLLADELGLEPSVELADTHRRILAQDPKLLPELATAVLTAPAAVLATATSAAGPGRDGERTWAGSSRQGSEPAWAAELRQDSEPAWVAELRQDSEPAWVAELRQDRDPGWVAEFGPDREPEWTARPEQEPTPAEPGPAIDADLQPIPDPAARQEDAPLPATAPEAWARRAPARMRPALGVLVRALVTGLGHILVWAGRRARWLASVLPGRVRAWWGWDGVEPCRGFSHRSGG